MSRAIASMEKYLTHLKVKLPVLYKQKDSFWALVWVSGLLLTWFWNILFLNAPARVKLQTAFFNTFFIGILVILFSMLLAWLLTMALQYSQTRWNGIMHLPLQFLVNAWRSIPQILGILIGFIIITTMLQKTTFSSFTLMLFIAFTIALFVFMEVVDLMVERITFFKNRDFYHAGLVCGISEFHLINIDILYKNSWLHLFNKAISILGMAVFLICSIDFILSVGLSNDVNALNFPTTLGSMLAQIDSKQDILAISTALLDWTYIPNLFFRHLQGISTAFLIVFSLFSIYKISDGFARRYRL